MFFEFIRKNSKILVIIVAITFAGGGVLVGLSGLFTNGQQQQQQPATEGMQEQPQESANIAVVNGEPIDYNQYQQILNSTRQQLAGQLDNLHLLSLKNRVLDQLIDQQLMIQQAQELGIEGQVSEEQIEAQLQHLIDSYANSEAEFEQMLAQQGATLDDVRAMLREELAEQQLVQALIQQLEAEVEASEEELLAAAERVQVSQILLSTDYRTEAEAEKEAQEVLAQLEEGLDFAQLAAEYSDDPTAVEGGQLGVVSPGQLDSGLDEVAFTLDSGEVSGAIKTEEGYHILKVTDRQELLTGEEDAEERQQLVQELRWEEAQRALEDLVEEQRAQADIEVDSAELRAYRAASEGDFAQAETDYKEALAESQSGIEDLYLYSNLGHVYAQQDKFEDAIAAYNEALEVSPNSAELRLDLANLYYEMEAEEEAQEELEKAYQLAQEEEDIFTLYRLQYFYDQLGYEEEAEELIETITELQG
ncbi:peptidylprolyl isomerase [Fuchsiella alkaliacetigena]|uniref:peptidylprolyl isomerase n=1 Tax=Fuchsiella alkaliacetigena TaxID=957042 RepID=UPI00200AFF2B|nr:peptidylprolyl isomerase [Fuchsiella alkaliacetigena]MCK8825232.1 peptidylprolyl isomerase [Fuchsiella alkaliacetigena]